MGRIMALLEAMATPIRTVDVPPTAASLSPMAVCYTADLTYMLFEQYYDRYLSEGHSSQLVFMEDSAGGASGAASL